ncbi:hypothetical protein [Chondromyces apiculatus]|uniref:Uncharacterized protein n=1 Tax=Chondromyces apiculatus DSM 436 TaxID=1192034 RepID=A0A017T2P3_9BACT|nr:hypothetical protein [Chondromyces apiculatus]EYF03498.1 Hypothetical protein CAP_5482 [Chondromyces apiculatus DSM 436]
MDPEQRSPSPSTTPHVLARIGALILSLGTAGLLVAQAGLGGCTSTTTADPEPRSASPAPSPTPADPILPAPSPANAAQQPSGAQLPGAQPAQPAASQTPPPPSFFPGSKSGVFPVPDPGFGTAGTRPTSEPAVTVTRPQGTP